MAAIEATVATAHADPPWATQQATELVRQGKSHEAQGDPETAISRYLEALKLDPTFGPGYLALADLYERRGDVVEAERTYATGLDHVNVFIEGYSARAKLRMRLGRAMEAARDREAACALAPTDVALARSLVDAYVAANALPAALGASRRMLFAAIEAKDAASVTEARLVVRALGLLVGDADPVVAGRDRGPLRRALSDAQKTSRAIP